jgi:molybdenum cofactor biosynthesis enzyme MoaA
MPERDTLTKLYVEITSLCNLDCQMCVQAWAEPLGSMPLEVFRDLMHQLRAFPDMPTVHLGGYGEPTKHPDFLEIVRCAKEDGRRVEMTTNGTLLDAALARAVIELDIDRVVVSIDGVTPEHYEVIRTYSSFDQVIENLRDLKRLKLRINGRRGKPEIGLAFVAMKRNVDDMPRLPMLAAQLGASSIQVSNVVPHSPEMEGKFSMGAPQRLHVPRLALGHRHEPAPARPQRADAAGRRAGVRLDRQRQPARRQPERAGNHCRFAHEATRRCAGTGSSRPACPAARSPVYLRRRRHGRRTARLGTSHRPTCLTCGTPTRM